MASVQQSRFLALPVEIRLNIYRAFINNNQSIELLRRDRAFTQTCRVIRNEAVEIFDNHGRKFPTINSMYRFLRSIGRVRRSRLHHLVFDYRIKSMESADQEKWRDIELMLRTFRLLKVECKALRTLVVWLNQFETISKLGPTWNHNNEFESTGSYYMRSPGRYCVDEIHGWRELSRLRGLQDVRFERYTVGSPPPDYNYDHNRRVIATTKSRMIEVRPAQKTLGAESWG